MLLSPLGVQEASAGELVQEWMTIEYKQTPGYRVMVVSSTGAPLNIANRPLHISDPISTVFVLNADGTRADPDLEREIIYLAQSSELLEEHTSYYTTWQLPEDYASWVRTDNRANPYRVFLPMATSDSYLELSVLCSTCSLGSYSRRVDRYKDVLRAAIFAEMHLDPEALRAEFNADFGNELLDVMDQAQSVVGTGSWGVEVLGLLDPYVQRWASSAFYTSYGRWTTAMGLVFQGITWAWWLNDAAMEVLVMHAWAQAGSAERLADLQTWTTTATYLADLDPALIEAVRLIAGEWEQIHEPDIQAVLDQVIESVGSGEVALSFVAFGVALANVAGLISPVLAPWLAVAFLGIEGWLLVRERAEQVASIGVAGTAAFDLMKEVTDNPGLWSNGDSLRYLLNLLNMSKYLAFHYYDVTVEKASGVDNWLFHPFDEEYDQWLDEMRAERAQRQSAFLLSRPETFLTGDGQGLWRDRSWLSTHIGAPNSVALTSPSVNPPSGRSSLTTSWTFRVTYSSLSNTAPDSVQLTLSGTNYPETQFDMNPVNPADTNYVDGAVYSHVLGPLDSGTYSYTFEASDGATLSVSGPVTLRVTVPQASQVAVEADPTSIPLDGVSKSLITATITTSEGQPMQGVQVTFGCSGVLGGFTLVDTGQVWNRVNTDDNGQAPIYFQPRSSGTAHITASLDSGLSNGVNVDVTGSNDIGIRIRFIRDSDLAYDVHVDAVYLANGDPIQFEDVTLSTSRGILTAVGNPSITGATITIQTNSSAGGAYVGAVRANLVVPSEGDTTITATVRSVTEAVSSYLGGEPARIRPFLHLSEDWAADWSADGSKVAVGGSDFEVHIIETDNWTQLIQWRPEDGFANVVYDVHFAPDRDEIAIASRYATRERVSDGVELWEGDMLGTRQVDWSPNGSWIAGGGRDETRVWNISGSLARSISHPGDWVRSLAFSPDSQYLLIGHDSGQVRIYRTSNWSLLIEYASDPDADDNDEVWAASWSPDSSKYVLSTAELGLLLFNRTSSTPYAAYTGHGIPSGVDALAWCPINDPANPGYGKIASSAGASLHVWDAATQQPLLEAPNSGANRALAWSPDCELLVFPAGVVAPWDTAGPDINVTSHFNGQAVDAGQIILEGTIQDTYLVDAATVSLNGGAATALSLNGSGGFAHAIDLAPGDNLISIYAEDGTGNPSTHELTITLLTDQSPPQISLPQGDDPGPTPIEICTLTTFRAFVQDPWSGVDPSTVSALVQHPDGVDLATVVLYDDGVQGGDAQAGDGVFMGQWDSCAAPEEGYFYINVQASDNNGNDAYADNLLLVEYYDLPTITQVAHTPLDPTDTDSVLVTALATDPSGISQASLEYSSDGGSSYTPVTMTYNAAEGAHQGTIPPHSMGQILYRVVAQDTGGFGRTSGTFSYDVRDASPPTFDAWSQGPSDLMADWQGAFQAQVDVSDPGGSGLTGITPQLRYKRGGYDADYTDYADMAPAGAGADSAYGAPLEDGAGWTFDIPMPDGGWQLIEGEVVAWQVRLTDLAGNTATSQARTDLVEDDDTLGPAIALSRNSFYVDSGEPLVITASISDAATGAHGVSGATLYFGEEFPYESSSVAGIGPGGDGEGQWTFTIPAQSPDKVGRILRFYIVASDADDTPATGFANDSGSYFAVHVQGEFEIFLPMVVRND
jgi:WD40 repeat protein